MPKRTAAASGSQVPPMIDVVSVKHLGGYKLPNMIALIKQTAERYAAAA